MPGDTVILRELPRGFIDDLPTEDQKGISEIAGKFNPSPTYCTESISYGHLRCP